MKYHFLKGQKRIHCSWKDRFCQTLGPALRESLWPDRCPGCDEVLLPGERRRGWCDACAAGRLFVEEPYCLHCGRPLTGASARYCREDEELLSERAPALLQNRAVYLYEGVVRDAIRRLKYENRRAYVRVLAKDASVCAGEWIRDLGVDAVVAMPMHPKRKAERGYNQAELLAEALAVRCGLPCEPLLCRRRASRPQQELARADRLRNLTGAMEVPEELRARAASLGCVLVVDDVYTTGASMEEAARALRAGGVGRVYGLTAAVSGRAPFQ